MHINSNNLIGDSCKKYLKRLVPLSWHLCAFIMMSHASSSSALAGISICVNSPQSTDSEWDTACRVVKDLPAGILALHEIRQSQNGRYEDVTLYLGSGIHKIEKPIIINSDIAPAGGGFTKILAAKPKLTSVVGGRLLERVELSSRQRSALKDLNIDVNSVKAYKLIVNLSDASGIVGAGVGFLHELNNASALIYSDRRVLMPSRVPYEDYYSLSDAEVLASRVEFLHVSRWLTDILRHDKARDLYVTGYWKYDWADESLPVDDVDVKQSVISLRRTRAGHDLGKGARVAVKNALAGLAVEDRYVIDTTDKTVLVSGAKSDEDGIFLASVENLLKLENASSVLVSGVSFSGARGDAISIIGGGKNRIDRSRVEWAGGRGVVIKSPSSGFSSGIVRYVGADGVVLDAGDRFSQTQGESFVVDSDISVVGMVARTYRPAVNVWGVGNVVIGNDVHDVPHSAFIFRGNGHRVFYNRIRASLLETGDAGVIYTNMDWTSHGNVIAFNVLEGTVVQGLRGGGRGIYIDDQSSGITVYGNMIVRQPYAVFVGGGSHNKVVRNILLESSPGLYADARGKSWQKRLVDDSYGTLRQRYTQATKPGSALVREYQEVLQYGVFGFGSPIDNLFMSNILVNSPVRVSQDAWSGWSGLDSNSDEYDWHRCMDIDRLWTEGFIFRAGSAIDDATRWNRVRNYMKVISASYRPDDCPALH